MKSFKTAVIAAVVSLTALLGLAGCNRSMDSSKNDKAVGQDTLQSKSDSTSDSMQKKPDQTGSPVSDAEITTKVKSAILNDPDLKVLQIHVDTNGGVVTLTGAVDSTQISEHADTIVSNVEGVKSVNNKLEVKTAG